MDQPRAATPTALDHTCMPMVLWAKAKRLGTWDPADIDLESDRDQWPRLDDLEREVILHLTTLFAGSEESVTRDLLPLLLVIAREGRLEEEIYLTSFLWEEAKHVEAFRRFLDEVAPEHGDLSRFRGRSHDALFTVALPTALGRLLQDPSPVAQAEASVTYNMVVEGVLAETGYHAFHRVLSDRGILPGTQKTIALLKRDESRHIAYGVHLLERLVRDHGDPIWDAVQSRMGALMPDAMGVIYEVFARYDEMPFDLRLDDFVDFAAAQFSSRLARLERARAAT